MAVHCDSALGEIEILPSLFFSGSEENVFAVMRRKRRPCGSLPAYAGWGPKQLEYEIDQGVWRRGRRPPPSGSSRSDDLWYELHGEAVETMYRAMLHLRYIPRDPMLN